MIPALPVVHQSVLKSALTRLCSTLAERAIIFFLHDHGPRAIEDIASGTSMTRFRALDSLLALQSRGAVDIATIKTSKNRDDQSKVYWSLTGDRRKKPATKTRIKKQATAKVKWKVKPVVKASTEEKKHSVDNDLDCAVKCPSCGIDVSFTIPRDDFNSSVDASGLFKKSISHGDSHFLAVHVNTDGNVVKTYGYECEKINATSTARNGEKPEDRPPRISGKEIAKESSVERGVLPVKKPEKKPVNADLNDILEEMKQFL